MKRYLHHDYERELTVNANGIAKHDFCIFHCIPYAFGDCFEKHNLRCIECNKFFEFFEFMHLHIIKDQVVILKEAKEHLQYYLAYTI